LILVPQQLEKIETIFTNLLDKSKAPWQDIDKQRFTPTATNIDLFLELSKGVKTLFYILQL
jgi:hypothetical protein